MDHDRSNLARMHQMSDSFSGSRLRQQAERAWHNAETFFNHLADSDRQWWPFAFLRPPVDQRFSTPRVALLAVLQGLPLGMLLLMVDAVSRHAALEQRLLTFLLTVCATVFVTNRITLAYFWNRRAERLARHRERLEVWKAGG
jgi:hypothetical protein